MAWPPGDNETQAANVGLGPGSSDFSTGFVTSLSGQRLTLAQWVSGGLTGFVLIVNGTAQNLTVVSGLTVSGGIAVNTGSVTIGVSSYNQVVLAGGVHNAPVTISATGTDSSVNIQLASKGNSSAVEVTKNLLVDGAATIGNGLSNTLFLSGAPGGSQVAISAFGSDTNIPIQYASAGSGAHKFYTGNGIQFEVLDSDGPNYATASGGTIPQIGVNGSAGDISMNLVPKGIGSVILPTASLKITTGNMNITAGNLTVGGNFSVAGTASYGGNIQVGTAVANKMLLAGGSTGTSPSIVIGGTDTNPGLNFLTQGIGPYGFYTGNGRQFAIGDAGGTTVNYVAAIGGVASQAPGFVVAGSDTNIGISIVSKNSGIVGLYTGHGLQAAAVDNTVTAVNYVTLTGAASGFSVKFGAAGADSNIGITWVPKGTGGATLQSGSLLVGAGNLSVAAGLIAQTVTRVLTGSPVPSLSATTFVSGTSSNPVTPINVIYAEDNIAVTGTAMGLYIDHIVNGASAAGSRAGLQVGLTVTSNLTGPAGQFYSNIYTTTTATANGNAGNLFGSAEEVHLNTGASNWNSIVGREIDIAVQTGVTVPYKAGLQIVQLSDDAVAGTLQDSALSFGTQSAGTPPRWLNLIGIGGPQGWWPVAAAGTILGTIATPLGGPAYAAAHGVDFSAITFSADAFKSAGFVVDKSGNIGVSNTLTVSGAGQQNLNVAGSFSGTTTNPVTTFNSFYIGADNVNVNAGAGSAYGLFVEHITGGAAAQGGRIALLSQITVTDTTHGSASIFYQGGSWSAQSSATGHNSNLFGGSLDATLVSGATGWGQLVGMEIDVSMDAGTASAYKVGLQIVQPTTDLTAGTTENVAFQIVNQPGASQPKWQTGISIGSPFGVWPIQATGTLIGTRATGFGGAYSAAHGIDFSAVTFSADAFKSTGFFVGPAGIISSTGLSSSTTYANDAAAAGGGVAIGGFYRNGSVVQCRIT